MVAKGRQSYRKNCRAVAEPPRESGAFQGGPWARPGLKGNRREEDEMKTKHTPGPWKPYGAPGNMKCAVAAGRDKLIASCGNLPYVGRFEAEANARLIAAAPELLETLKSGEDIISGLEAEADNAGIDLSEVRAWWQKAGNLIAKTVEP